MTDFNFSSTAEEVTEGVSLAGKTVVVTGCNSGIGLETARVLGLRGAFVVGAARTEAKAKAALAEAGVEGAPIACELSEPASVRAAVASIRGLERPLDAVVCNAGIMALPERREAHGVELQLMTNHVGHFMFATGLLDTLSPEGRVVVVSSGAHRMAPEGGIDFDDLSGEKHYEAWRHYGQSKLANILFARALAKRFEGTGRVAASLHPGVIKTNLGRNNQDAVDAMLGKMKPSGIKSIAQGAATQCLLAVHPSTQDAAGRYYSDCQPAKTTPLGQDDALAEQLWTRTEALVASFA